MLGQSGKMILTNGPSTINVTMDHIYELDAVGNQIGNRGPPSGRHSLNTFAPVDFTINNTPRRTREFGVPADCIDFSTTLVGGAANFLVTTLIFLHNGVIHPTVNESWAVAGGTVKFSIQVSSWPFCNGESGNPCQGDSGAFLEFGMEIKGSADTSLPEGEKRFTLATDAATGNNITLELSDEVLLDGQWVAMPAGYPKIEFQGTKQLFKFRMPRFTASALYDPVISGMGVAPPPVPPTTTLPPPWPPSPPLLPLHPPPLSPPLVQCGSDPMVCGSNLASAYADATDGDELVLTDGTYSGVGPEVLRVSKSVSLRAQTLGHATLDGQDARRVLTIDAVAVTLRSACYLKSL